MKDHKINIYKYLDYRPLVSEWLKKSYSQTQKAFAETLEIQPSYLSRVLKKEVHLTDDQVFLAVSVFAFSSKETEYFMLIFQYQKSGHKERKKHLLQQIRLLQSEARNASDSLSSPKLTPEGQENLSKLYLEPNLMVVYFYLTIDKFQKKPAAIFPKLGISTEKGNSLMDSLIDLKLVSVDKLTGAIKPISDRFHLNRTSPLYQVGQRLRQLRSANFMEELDENKKYSFFTVMSSNPETNERLKDFFIEFLEKAEKLVGDSPPEKVYQMQFDLFEWNKEE